MWLKWFPWKFAIRRLARSHGFMDPITLLSYFRRFAQPSEVMVPIELLREGVVFHARGLINSRVIQQNLDWVWPYWVNRQFDPRCEAFIPRAFSLTHINLTARNWTAVGIPGCDLLPIVDPRGLLTPFWDGWSLDAWIVAEDGTMLIPSRLVGGEGVPRGEGVSPLRRAGILPAVRGRDALATKEQGQDALATWQRLDFEGNLAVVTSSRSGPLELESRVEVVTQPDLACRLALRA